MSEFKHTPRPMEEAGKRHEAKIRASERAAVLREVREAVDEILRSLWERQRATSMTGTKIYALFEPGGRFAEREKREGK